MAPAKRIASILVLDSALGRTLTLFMALLLIAAVVTSLWTLDRSWRQTVQETERNALNLSVSQARQAEDTFLQVELAIADINRTLKADAQPIADIDPAKYYRLLHELSVKLPQLHGLFIYDAQGNWRATSFSPVRLYHNNSDREYFIWHRTNPHLSLHIGHVIRSRSTNELVIPVSMRMNDASSEFAGIILATVKIDYFRRFYSYFSLQDRDLLAMLNTDGTALYLRPFSERIINKNLSASPLFTQQLAHKDSGNATWVSAVDGVKRIYGFARLERYPLVVAAGYDLPALWASWQRDSLPDLILSAVFLVVILLMSALMFRQVRRNVKNQLELATLRDELTTINHTLQAMALVDGLTGLANRRQFELSLSAALDGAGAKPVALVMLDVDAFKAYNDTYGHVAGDNCLRQVSAALRRLSLPAGTVIARYGGEEFAMILPQVGPAQGLDLAHQAVAAVRALRLRHTAATLRGTVTLSAGCYVYKAGQDDAQSLKEQADRALYQAKQQGKDRAVLLENGRFTTAAQNTLR